MNFSAKATARFERGLAISCTVIALILQVRWGLHAGGLWRDEANSINLGLVPSWGEFYTGLQFDSFPLLWLSLIRLIAQAGLATDGVLRTLGLGFGLATVAVLWTNARRMGTGLPMITMALLGLNSTIICWGNSNRAFGLGLFLSLILVPAIWRMVESPSPSRISLALLVALLAVHTVFFNAVVLFALGLGGFAVALRNRQWKPAAAVAGVGAIAALSLLIYRPIAIWARDWNILLKIPDFSFLWFIKKLCEAIAGEDGSAPTLLWSIALIGALALGAASQRQPGNNEGKDRKLFALITLVTGFASYFLFLKSLSYPSNPWYYIALMGLMATSMEILLSGNKVDSASPKSPETHSPHAVVRAGIALAALLVAAPLVWNSVGLRYTNIDLIAAKIQSKAAKNDLVVLSPWVLAIPFERYYEGLTPWRIIPDMPPPKVHRWDRVKQRMALPNPIEAIRPVIEQIKATLESGGNVWVVGTLHMLPKGKRPIHLDSAPIPGIGWNNALYLMMWDSSFAYYLQLHAKSVREEEVPVPWPVRGYEEIPLVVLSGWRD